MNNVLFPNANEKLEDKKKLNTNDLKVFFASILFIVIMFFYSMINDKNLKIESLQDNKIELYSELYKYKKQAIIQNEDILTKYLKENFHNLKEYRVIYLNSDNLTVIINEPVKTTENEIGYSKENWYEVNIELTPNNFQVINHSKIFINSENIEKNMKNNTNSFFDNVFIKQIEHFIYKIFTFFISFFIDIEQGKNMLNGINQMVIDTKVEAIEKPILFKTIMY